MDPTDTDTIDVIVAEGEEIDGLKGGVFRASSDAVLRRVPVGTLQANLRQLSKSIAAAFSDLDTVGRFRLKEVTLQVEVTASGGVALIGTASVEGKGAISLTFRE
jgi:hypothetical protein